MNRPRLEVDDLARIEALQGALRRLRGEVQRLAADNQFFHEPIETRAKIPKEISTS